MRKRPASGHQEYTRTESKKEMSSQHGYILSNLIRYLLRYLQHSKRLHILLKFKYHNIALLNLEK